MMAPDIRVSEVMRELTISVRIIGLPSLKARIWLGVKLLNFAAWVCGTKVEVELKP